MVNVELSLYDVPTESCTTHKMVKICGTSKHAVNEYCELVPGNTTYEVGLLDVTRGFPIRGIKVLDQAFVVRKTQIVVGAEIQHFFSFYSDGSLLRTFNQSFFFIKSGFLNFSQCLAEVFFHFTVHNV